MGGIGADSPQEGILKNLIALVLLAGLIALTGFAGGTARCARSDSTVSAVSPSDFGGLVVLSGFRPLAVDLLWMRAEELARERRYYELLSLYNLITTIDPHFEAAWAYNSFNLALRLSVLEDTPGQRWKWVREGLLYAMKGAEKNPSSDQAAFAVAWIIYYAVPQDEYYVTQVSTDERLNPEGLPIMELARLWAERAFETGPHTVYVDWMLEAIYRTYGERAASTQIKLRYLRRRLEIWQHVKANKPQAADKAAERISQIQAEIAQLTPSD